MLFSEHLTNLMQTCLLGCRAPRDEGESSSFKLDDPPETENSPPEQADPPPAAKQEDLEDDRKGKKRREREERRGEKERKREKHGDGKERRRDKHERRHDSEDRSKRHHKDSRGGGMSLILIDNGSAPMTVSYFISQQGSAFCFM
jgi:hypothetical protein